MDVFSRARKVLAGLVSHIKIIDNIERQNSGKKIFGIEDLSRDLITNKNVAQQMIEEIQELVELNTEKREKLEEKIKLLEDNEVDYQRRIAQLEREIFKQDAQIENLTEDVQGFRAQLVATQCDLVETKNKLTSTQDDHERTKNKLKEIESALCTGQIAYDFEKDLATYIYPHDKKFGSRKIFTNMKKWLEEKKNTQQGREANEKWKELQREFLWSSEHERIFFKLLESRKKCAHPQIDWDAVQSEIPDNFTDQEKTYITDIVGMIDRVNELMQ